MTGIFGSIYFDVIGVTRNKEFICEKGCYNSKNCSIKPIFTCKRPLTSRFNATEVIVDITNTGDIPFSTKYEDWLYLDTESYAWSAKEMCDKISEQICSTLKYGAEIPPHSTMRVYMYFPEMDNEMCALVYLKRDIFAEARVGELSKTANDRVGTKCDGTLINTANIDPVKRSLSKLEQLYSRRAVAFTANSIENTEMDIAALITDISANIKDLPPLMRNSLTEQLNDISTKWKNYIRVSRELLGLSQGENISFLCSISPREFEEWTGDLYRALGYDVEITPYSNDGGIDVWCRKDDSIIAIQCKRYNGIVDDSYLIKFINDLKDQAYSKAVFLTTGYFSITAHKYAKIHSIELYDRTNLSSLIKIAIEQE